MKPTMRKWWLVAVLALVATGCAAVRKVTYPPDFVYLSRSEVTGSMKRMSSDIWQIDDILGGSETVLPYKREKIIALLEDMQKVTDKLGAGTVQTNHPFIDQNIDSFKRDVTLALDDVKNDPPAYYRAGRLSGRCLACHRLRR